MSREHSVSSTVTTTTGNIQSEWQLAEELLHSWAHTSTEKAHLLEIASKVMSNRQRWLVIPSIIFGTVATTFASLYSVNVPSDVLPYTVTFAVLSAISTILSSVNTFLNLSARSADFREGHARYSALSALIDKELAMPIEKRLEVRHFLEQVLNEYQSLQHDTIPNAALKEYEKYIHRRRKARHLRQRSFLAKKESHERKTEIEMPHLSIEKSDDVFTAKPPMSSYLSQTKVCSSSRRGSLAVPFYNESQPQIAAINDIYATSSPVPQNSEPHTTPSPAENILLREHEHGGHQSRMLLEQTRRYLQNTSSHSSSSSSSHNAGLSSTESSNLAV